MTSYELKMTLRKLAVLYAHEQSLPIDTSHRSAVIFKRLPDSFKSESFNAVAQNPDWLCRTQKPHQSVADVYEMQSSNSSDALLLNIFCHPQINEWKGVLKLLNVPRINPVFGFKAQIEKNGTNGDATEIDLVINDIFIEAKLTEEGFTQKDESIIEQYTKLTVYFDIDRFDRVNQKINNYQIIRNLLASIQHNKRHILFCDARRPDLVRDYMNTVSCLLDSKVRSRCRIIFWQELARLCGKDMSIFLRTKYGI